MTTKKKSKTLLDTIEVIKKIKCDRIVLNVFTPFPGTEAFDLCKNLGRIDGEHDFRVMGIMQPAPDPHGCHEQAGLRAEKAS